MKVILLVDVKGTGKKDQILKVSDGFARNYLFPKKWAMEATDSVVKEIERKQSQMQKRELQRMEEALARAKELRNKVIRISAKCGSAGRLYGSITAQEIADAIQEQYGIQIDKRKIELKEPIRQLGDVSVSVWVYSGVTTEMTVTVTRKEGTA
jgi:large subunit ribosomal protein L9